MSSVPEAHPISPPDLLPEEVPFAADPATGRGRFHHPWGAVNDRGPGDVLRWKLLQRNPFAADKKARAPRLPTTDARAAWEQVDGGARVQWLGHASILIELQGQHVLIDPIFGGAGPGVRRLVPPPRLPEALPRVDVLLISHGHYDHLDRRSIAAVRRRFPEAVVGVPKGLARSIPGDPARVVELSWFEAIEVGGLRCTLTPAQHWHLRSGWDHNRALWGGWMVQGPPSEGGERRGVYHSGDTGWFDGFGVIRKVLGAPDVAVLPLGAYEPRWFMGVQHMPPEDSVQAFLDLGARHFVGMHWGTFDLSDEPVDHGAFTLLPQQVTERGLAADRVHVLSHGGVLGFGAAPQTAGRAGVD